MILRNMHARNRSANELALTIVFILLSSVLAGCGGTVSQAEVIRSEPVPAQVSTAETVAQNPEPTVKVSALIAELDLQALGDATYNGILDRPVTLVDGRYEGEPFVAGGASRPAIALLTEPVAYGDLNGDGRMDAAVILVSEAGGSGTFVYLATVESRDGAPVNTATTLLGDREQVRSLAIDGGQLLVNLLSHAAGDPACCPSLETIRTFRLQEGQLVDETTE